MMSENVSLAALTTLRVGGPARFVYSCDSIDSIRTAVAHARDSGLRIYPLGQGSNVLAGDAPIDAVILKMESSKLSFVPNLDSTEVIADAGVSWDALVRAAAEKGLWGVENLAGIPGTCGAAPVQNIGAYGAELADTFDWLECYDAQNDTVLRLERADCGFGYRDSRFKKEPHLIITRIALTLSRVAAPKLSYPDLQRLTDTEPTPQAIGEAVRRIRVAKFPDLATHGTAGSFFKNPTISIPEYDALKERYPELPGFPNAEGIKIPLAWILDHVLALRGFHIGAAYLFENQPLVLVTEEGATAHDVNILADAIAQKVFGTTKIHIEREVRSLA